MHCLKVLFIVVLASLMFGCGGPTVKPGRNITIYVYPDKNTNKGNIFYMAILPMDEPSYLDASYNKVASELFKSRQESNQDDPFAGLKKYIVDPKDGKMRIDEIVAENKGFGIFFLFTKPGDKWKVFIPQNPLKRYRVYLGEDNVDALK